MNNNLKKIYQDSKMSQSVFSNMVNLSQSQLNHYLTDRQKLTKSIFERIKKDYTVSFYVNEILETAEKHLSINEETFEFDLSIGEVTLDIVIKNPRLAYRNKYRFDGEVIGKYRPEPDHNFEFNEIYINKVYGDFELKEEINNKLFLICKI